MRLKKRLIKICGVIMKLLLLFIFGWPFFWMISTSLQSIDEVNRVTPTFFPAVLQKIIFGCILIALMMPTQITFLPIYLLMSKWGMIDSLIPQILPFITNAFAIFLLRQYFMQVENELIEAAKLDGASEWRLILQIMMPMSKPALAAIILFSFVGQWNEYFWPLVMTNADKFRTLPVAIAQLKEMEGMANWQIVMAGNAILVLPVLLVYLFASKQIMKSFAYSGIK